MATVIFDGVAPAVYTDLDLGVGQRCLALIRIYSKQAVETARYYYFRQNGEARDTSSTNKSSNSRGVTHSTNGFRIDYVWVVSDAAGLVEWECPVASIGVTLTLETYLTNCVFPENLIYAGNTPLAWTELDLGVGQCIAYLRHFSDGISAPCVFRKHGDTDLVDIGSVNGMTKAEADANLISYCTVITDADGKVDWVGGWVQPCTLTLMAYITVASFPEIEVFNGINPTIWTPLSLPVGKSVAFIKRTYINSTSVYIRKSGETESVVGGLNAVHIFGYQGYFLMLANSLVEWRADIVPGSPTSVLTLDANAVLLATVTTDPASGVVSDQATLNGTLDDDGGEACDCGFEWGETVAYGNTTPTQSRTSGQTFSQVIIGLDPCTTYHYRAFATNAAGTVYGGDMTFTTTAALPTVTTNPATSIGANEATLNGTLDDDGCPSTGVADCGFEWGESPALGNVTSTVSRATGQTFSQAISGLVRGWTYYFRSFATNAAGTGYGSVRSFTTVSSATNSVITLPATNITERSATIHGMIEHDAGDPGYVRFQWGLTKEYGADTPWRGPFSAGYQFDYPLSDLAEGTAFHFRAQFRNRYGVVSGNDAVFSTLSPLGPITWVSDEDLLMTEMMR